MARLVSRSELARIAGVSPAAITKACKGPLAAACVGKRVDLDHPAVQAYLSTKGARLPTAGPDPAPTSSAPSPRKRTSAPTAPRRPPPKAKPVRPTPQPRRALDVADPGENDARPADVDDDIEGYAHRTLHELTELFGTVTSFKDWLDARKKIADIRAADLKTDEAKGRLISRELVKTHVFGAIEAGNRRLLGDTPKTIARRLYALAKSGAPVEEAEKVVRELISSQLKPVKTTAVRVLRNA